MFWCQIGCNSCSSGSSDTTASQARATLTASSRESRAPSAKASSHAASEPVSLRSAAPRELGLMVHLANFLGNVDVVARGQGDLPDVRRLAAEALVQLGLGRNAGDLKIRDLVELRPLET